MLTIPSTYFKERPQFKFKRSSIFSFILLASFAWVINIGGQLVFASQNLLPFFVRTLITLATDTGLLYVSFRLLKQNGLPESALGLSVTKKMFPVVCWGALIGLIMVAIIAALLFMFIPFHFISGPVNGFRILEDGISYLVGNTL